ncbi:flavin reductase domain-containing protein [Ameyamaea chiangmaiensis NBRC 103196]|uniref:Flavin reductase family protein n=2 Tax=Ameyamaea chiangmaiensis TaxID=442969 RepID=A0A850PDZ4_9PROT|nr:flavin reductase family protein [Ameyamaea chiangmaiensis]MBS4075599.1 flavin reductase family protein [Ameyamaea chiangmaiensis]NVN40162.1 flavin reductase family protein [Ameyamaea chiangmaiensis]GBQ70809.1 flavin reductase domain-containing protein [Ameyamaea chiangmaiensis NBRC 103196]
MQPFPLDRAFTLLESGPVTLVTTHGGGRDNVMTITWTMVLDFNAHFAITTGPWNHSWNAINETRECVVAIPCADMLDTVVGIGLCSGQDTDKFETFSLGRRKADKVKAPLLSACLANIECRVVEIIDAYGIVILEGIAAHAAPHRDGRSPLHAIGDGTFVTEGPRLDRRMMMRPKLPPSVIPRLS